ncbi:MAG: hypothetical protein VXU46_04075, partial [Planctomycetota bacterium]|nr:hypothetical protein [Planctomycetota bacterium]
MFPSAGNHYLLVRNINEVDTICWGEDDTSMKAVHRPQTLALTSMNTLFFVRTVMPDMRTAFHLLLVLCFLCVASTSTHASDQPFSVDDLAFFEKKVRPLL